MSGYKVVGSYGSSRSPENNASSVKMSCATSEGIKASTNSPYRSF